MSAMGRYGLAVFLGVAVVGGVSAGDGTVPTSGDARLVAAAASRGGLLYENHCTGCHESGAHIRANRKAKSMADLRGWVTRWSGELKLNWSSEEIDDVAQYLARRYYKCNEKTEKC